MRQVFLGLMLVLSVPIYANSQTVTPTPAPTPRPLEYGNGESAEKCVNNAVEQLRRVFDNWCREKCSTQGGVITFVFPPNEKIKITDPGIVENGRLGCSASIDPNDVSCECRGKITLPSRNPVTDDPVSQQ